MHFLLASSSYLSMKSWVIGLSGKLNII